MGFVVGIVIAVILAYFFPFWGSTASPIPLGAITSWGIALIFFFYGLKLKFTDIKSGLSNWRLHVLIQSATFVLFPLLILIIKPLMTSDSLSELWLSFFFLAALPSTVSSSVVMTSLAKGNLPAAILNASISGIIGIIITPLWMGLVLTAQEGFDFLYVYKQLLLEIVIPLSVGLLLQGYFRNIVNRYGHALSTFDKSVILLIVYKSFAMSFTEDVFSNIPWSNLALIFAGVVLLFYLVYGLLTYLCRLLKFSDADTTTALFCGSKKSLTHGTVFAQAIFGTSSTSLGLMLMPLMLFHAFQIFVISIIATRKGKALQETA